jgi:molecular chaperone DnaK
MASVIGTAAPQFNFDFEDENTVQADYEAID